MPTLSRPECELYYEAYGTEHSSAIVFAHGAGGNAGIWFNQIAQFSPEYQCIAFDHRCFARSPAPAHTVTVHHFRDDLLSLLDTLQVERAHLVGQSMGGFTVLRTTLDAPDRVASLTLSCTTGGIHNPNPSPAMQSLTQASGRGTDGIKATMAKKSLDNGPADSTLRIHQQLQHGI